MINFFERFLKKNFLKYFRKHVYMIKQNFEPLMRPMELFIKLSKSPSTCLFSLMEPYIFFITWRSTSIKKYNSKHAPNNYKTTCQQINKK